MYKKRSKQDAAEPTTVKSVEFRAGAGMAVFGLLIRGGPHLACPLFVLVSWTMMPVFDISCPSHDNVLP